MIFWENIGLQTCCKPMYLSGTLLNHLNFTYMKKTLLVPFAAFLLALSVSGCKNDQQPAADPDVTLTEGEVTLNTVSFTIASANATKVAYMTIVSGKEDIPDVNTILENGTPVGANEETGITVSGLEPATEYIIAAAAENDGLTMTEPATITMSTESDLFADIVSDHTDLMWYGPLGDTGSDQFCLQLSNAEVSETLMPLEGGELVRLYLFTAPVADRSDITLAPGTYTMANAEEYEHFTYDASASIFAMGTNGEDWMQINYESGEVTVEYADGQYTITANMVIADGEGSKVRARYTGPIEAIDYSDGFRHFTTDKNEVMNGMTGAISSSSMVPDLDDYTVTLYNCPLDEDGFIIGAGYVFNCELYAKAVPYEEYDFSGTYTPNPDWEIGIYPEGTYITGFVYDMYGMKMPVGTYLSEYNDQGALIAAGLVQDGTITVSRADGMCRIDADLVTDRGVSLTISYDGPDVPLANYKSNAPANAPVPASRPESHTAVNGWTQLR